MRRFQILSDAITTSSRYSGNCLVYDPVWQQEIAPSGEQKSYWGRKYHLRLVLAASLFDHLNLGMTSQVARRTANHEVKFSGFHNKLMLFHVEKAQLFSADRNIENADPFRASLKRMDSLGWAEA